MMFISIVFSKCQRICMNYIFNRIISKFSAGIQVIEIWNKYNACRHGGSVVKAADSGALVTWFESSLS